MTENKNTDRNRPLKSFVIRASRLTTSQKKALDTLWDDHVIPFDHQPLDLDKIFSVHKPLVIEIGFGMGDSLLEMAIKQPEFNFIGIEVHQPGVGKLLHGIQENEVGNLKIVSHDAVEVLEKGFGNESVDRLLIFFPDPWHKKRHNKRRLIQSEFIQMIRTRLKVRAEIHMATDWQPYAEHMMEIMSDAQGYENCIATGSYWTNPKRPETKFERRGIKLGHGVWDLLFRKIN